MTVAHEELAGELSEICALHPLGRLGLRPSVAVALHRMGVRVLADLEITAIEVRTALRAMVGDQGCDAVARLVRKHLLNPCVEPLPSSHVGELTAPSSISLAAAHFERIDCGHLETDMDDWDGIDWVAFIEGQPGSPRWCPELTATPPSNTSGEKSVAELHAVLAAWRAEQIRFHREAIADALHYVLVQHGRALHYTLLSAIARDRFPELAVSSSEVYGILHGSPHFERTGRGVFRAVGRPRGAQ